MGFKVSLNLFTTVGVVLILHFGSTVARVGGALATEEEGRIFLQELEPRYIAACNQQITTRWAYITNVTDHTADESTAADTEFLRFQSSIQAEILANFSNWNTFPDNAIRREFKYLAIKGPATMSSDDVASMNRLQSQMETAYATSTVCDYNDSNKCDLRLDPEIEEKLHTVEDWDELAHYWTEWHNSMSKAVRPANYTQFIKWQTDMARANGFNDMSEMWLSGYDDESIGWTAVAFKRQMLDIWEQLRPSYNILHAYVRMKLRMLPEYQDKITKYGYLPAHILGNMWGQDWAKLDIKTKPFPNAPSLDATEAMIKSNYTIMKMFQESDKFFTGMGLLPMSQTFWEKSMLERPTDGREVVCHASAEDFCLGRGSTDFRIKQCTKVTMDDLVTVHHEMGHIEYFMQYTDENYIFRDGANPGFHEAIGDALALAVVTPKHLQCVLNLDLGLDIDCASNVTQYQSGVVTETDYNFLFITALQKFVFFPFAISMDNWRWEVFEGKLSESQYNERWWELRKNNQGIEPPFARGVDDFDAPAKYHIVANVPYIRYFVSHILQFQFYEAMCKAAGEFDPANNSSKPLYQCDFAGSTEAGVLLGNMMKLGFTRGWPVALEAITGSKIMSIDPLLNYFKPLFEYMQEELDKNGESPCFGPACEEVAADYLQNKFETESSTMNNRHSKAEWAYSTNLTNVDAQKEVEKVKLEASHLDKKQYKEYISQFDYKSFKNESLKRQFRFLSDLGISALNESDVIEYNDVLAQMKKIYGVGKICPFTKPNCNITTDGLSLNPSLESILAKVEDYDEMAYVWKNWRDATGIKVRPLYYKYVELSNKAAKANGYANAGDYWLRKYESKTFRQDLEELWQEVKPLYEELHAYVRFKLSKEFPGKVKLDEAIPAHVLGNPWSQSFDNLYRFMVPYPNATSFDVTEVLKEKFTPDVKGVRGMFEVANDFFGSLGLPDMKMAYGDKALLVKPTDGTEVVCHASAWDFSDGKDFRIKMCTNVDQKDFITIHHELGHINYYLNYKHQPVTYRTGANPGFHEAIGDVVALSVSTPKHMSTIGYINFKESSHESTINFLTQKALEKIAFLPFGYLIDNYRWKIFDGTIPQDKLEYHWMKMRNEYQGIVPPVERSENDFDPGAKYHVPGNTPYIRYFVSYILQFQIHKSLCVEAGQYPDEGPLHNCDIYKNAAAGAKFKKLMESGFSKNWQDLLQEVTGVNKLDAKAIIEYFQPLTDYLKEYRKTEGYPTGWSTTEFEKFYKAN